MKTIVGFKEAYSTKELGWPIDLTYCLSEGRIFLSLEESLAILNLKEYTQARGWKKIDSFLAVQGMYNNMSLINHYYQNQYNNLSTYD